MSAAYALGYQGGSIYSNPFKDGTTDARMWVDGWAAGLKEYGPYPPASLAMGWFPWRLQCKWRGESL